MEEVIVRCCGLAMAPAFWGGVGYGGGVVRGFKFEATAMIWMVPMMV